MQKKYLSRFVFLTLGLLAFCLADALAQTGRVVTNFDKSWRFIKEDATGADQPAFNDSQWRKLDVPHDWSIEGPYDQNNPTGSGGGYLPAGIGWYRKTFTLPATDAKRKVSIEFDGVMCNSEVWINGFYLGKRPYGYVSFAYDMTGHLNFGGKPNMISVRVDNSQQPASRYYTGSGIYRHVRLVSENPVHFDHWGVYIKPLQVTAQKATISVQAKVVNQSAANGTYTLQTTLIDPAGKTIKTTVSKQSIAAGQTAGYDQQIQLSNPQLWDIDHPHLYKAVTRILSGTTVLDNLTTNVGVRDAHFEPATGFWLNGKNIKLYGVCLHHDGGAVGSAVPLRVWERRFEKLKDIGANAIRTSHNEVAPEFLDLCDRMGFLVMDETFDTWEAPKPPALKGYNLYFANWWDKDTRDQVMRDRNHPSIVIYSIGNEIHDNLKDSSGFHKYKMQQDLVHQYDPGRPVTMALLQPNLASQVYKTGFAERMDITGQNYRENELVAYHQAHPDRVVIGTENGHTLDTWLALRDNAFMSGQFLWTGVDYLGESMWPGRGSASGLIDRTGNWHTNGLQRQAWWSSKPVVHIQRNSGAQVAGRRGGMEYVSDWTPADPSTYKEARVQAFSNCDEVELFLNGRSLGVKQKSPVDSPRVWRVSYEKGTLKAVARNKGKVVATDELKTAGEPVKIQLTTDRPHLKNNWDDVAYITASLVDANGVVCPNVEKNIQFSISGSGVIAAVDNADRTSHEPYQVSQRNTYKGWCIALVKAKASGGAITVKASAPGLKDGTITMTAQP